MLRLDPSCAVFTSTHLLLVRLCLHAKAYACILPVLNKHICHFPGSTERFPHKSSPVLCANHESSLAFITNSSGLSAPLSSRDLSRYFLYGGMVYLALKKWSEASHFLELVMSMPTTGPVSMIMVEAYKKWVLVGLLETGKVSRAEPPCFPLFLTYVLASPVSYYGSSACVQNVPVYCKAVCQSRAYFRAPRLEPIECRD